MSRKAKLLFSGLILAGLLILPFGFPLPPRIATISKDPVFRPSSPDQIKTVERALSIIIAIIRDDLHLPVVDPLTVYKYQNTLSFAFFGLGVGKWLVEEAGIAASAKNNEIHVNMSAMKETTAINCLEVIAHEYGHNLHYAVTNNDALILPRWVTEGFATWIASKVLHSLGWRDYTISVHRALLELAQNPEVLPTLSHLDSPATWNRETVKSKGAIRTYVLAFVAFHSLIQREGLPAIMNYLKTGNFDSSFRITSDQFVKDFDNYISELGAQKGINFKIDKPHWKIGDSWLYTVTVGGKTSREKRAVIGDARFQDQQYFVVKVGNEESLYTRDTLNQLVTMEEGKLASRRDKPNMVLNWPLEQGKEWRNSYRFENFKRRISGNIDHLMVVANREKIKVPAGIFDAAKIEAYDSKTGRLAAEYWYSPVTKSVIKFRSYVFVDGFREDELIGFKVAA